MNTCKVCGVALPDRRMRYCSDKCRHSTVCTITECNRRTHNGRVICPMHEKRMQVWGSYDTRPPRSCVLCERDFVPVKKFENYCSVECRSRVRTAYTSWYFSNEEKKAELAMRRKLKRDSERESSKAVNQSYSGYKTFIVNQERKLKTLNGIQVVEFSARDLELRMSMFGFSCWLCGGPFEAIDHVKPLSSSGPHMLSNLRPSCRECNSRKAWTWPYSAVIKKFEAWRDVTDRLENGTWTAAPSQTRNMNLKFLLQEAR